jgi:hypothetical protein
VIVTHSMDQKGVKNVSSTRGGFDCSLVAWVLGLSRFQRTHSRPADNRHSDVPPALLQRQISHSVNHGTPEGGFSAGSYRLTSPKSSHAIR